MIHSTVSKLVLLWHCEFFFFLSFRNWNFDESDHDSKFYSSFTSIDLTALFGFFHRERLLQLGLPGGSTVLLWANLYYVQGTTLDL